MVLVELAGADQLDRVGACAPDEGPDGRQGRDGGAGAEEGATLHVCSPRGWYAAPCTSMADLSCLPRRVPEPLGWGEAWKRGGGIMGIEVAPLWDGSFGAEVRGFDLSAEQRRHDLATGRRCGPSSTA